MSDRKKLIDVVWKIDTMRAVGVELSECVDHLISNGVTVQKWIPVSERLPDENDNTVLVYAAGYMELGWFDEDDSVWKSDEYAWDADEVTHWLPLPEPPKECE